MTIQNNYKPMNQQLADLELSNSKLRARLGKPAVSPDMAMTAAQRFEKAKSENEALSQELKQAKAKSKTGPKKSSFRSELLEKLDRLQAQCQHCEAIVDRMQATLDRM
ncbi:hypothetical protein P0Y35_05865 [Kiritimatiellaeota bacterium B1221]|nr:hypothetical protein [Kiritimatiellaeota bacterium B1221]